MTTRTIQFWCVLLCSVLLPSAAMAQHWWLGGSAELALSRLDDSRVGGSPDRAVAGADLDRLGYGAGISVLYHGPEVFGLEMTAGVTQRGGGTVLGQVCVVRAEDIGCSPLTGRVDVSYLDLSLRARARFGRAPIRPVLTVDGSVGRVVDCRREVNLLDFQGTCVDERPWAVSVGPGIGLDVSPGVGVLSAAVEYLVGLTQLGRVDSFSVYLGRQRTRTFAARIAYRLPL